MVRGPSAPAVVTESSCGVRHAARQRDRAGSPYAQATQPDSRDTVRGSVGGATGSRDAGGELATPAHPLR